MKTYTFKIKVDTDKVVIACHMQFEQFFDSVKMSGMENLLVRYPKAYITASDYYDGDDFIQDDYALSTLDSLLQSKDLKSYLLSGNFVGFVGDDSFNVDKSHDIELSAVKFIEEENKFLDDEEVESGISETEKE